MTHQDVMCSIGGMGDWEFLSNPLSPTTTFKMPDRNCLHHGALQEDKRAVSQSPSRTAGGNYVEIDRWDCISLAAYGPKQTRLVLLLADKPQGWRLVLFNAGITSDAWVDEEIVVEVVIGRRDLSDDALG